MVHQISVDRVHWADFRSDDGLFPCVLQREAGLGIESIETRLLRLLVSDSCERWPESA